MKISELVKKLEELRVWVGDIEVDCRDYYGDISEVTEVEVTSYGCGCDKDTKYVMLQ